MADVQTISRTNPSTCRKIKYSNRSDTPGSCPTEDHRWSATRPDFWHPTGCPSTAGARCRWRTASPAHGEGLGQARLPLSARAWWALPAHGQGEPAHSAAAVARCPGRRSRSRTGSRPAVMADRDPRHYRGEPGAVPGPGRRVLPHAAQAIKLVRRGRRLSSRKWTTVTVYAITSLTAFQADPALLARRIRGHWAINKTIRPTPKPIEQIGAVRSLIWYLGGVGGSDWWTHRGGGLGGGRCQARIRDCGNPQFQPGARCQRFPPILETTPWVPPERRRCDSTASTSASICRRSVRGVPLVSSAAE